MKLQKFWWKKWWCMETVCEHFMNKCVKIVWKKYLLAMGELFSVWWDQKKPKKKETQESLKRMWGRLLFWLRFKRKTPHDKDTFENARVLLLLVAASRKKGEEVELSESATTHFSHNSLTGDHHILIKNFQGVLTLSYWNPRHTIICEDAILWEHSNRIDTQEET